MREVGGGLAQFALRVQHSAEIVVGLRMIRLEQQQALVDARGLFELVLPLEAFRLDEQSGGGNAGEAGAMAAARWALLERGAALLSVHPLRLLMCRSWSSRRLTEERRFYTHFRYRSCGRVAEGGGLLNSTTPTARARSGPMPTTPPAGSPPRPIRRAIPPPTPTTRPLVSRPQPRATAGLPLTATTRPPT